MICSFSKKNNICRTILDIIVVFEELGAVKVDASFLVVLELVNK